MELSDQTFVSVIICAHNEAAHITSCLESVLRNSYNSFEIIFVDDASTDGTLAFARLIHDRRLRVIQNPSQLGPSASRNRGAHESCGSILLFTDADCIVADDWIETMTQSLLRSDAHVLGVEGSILYETPKISFAHEVPVNPFYPKRAFPLMNVPGQDYATANIGYRREAFLRAGGFNSARYVFGREDTDLARRILHLGGITFNSAARVTHTASSWTWPKLWASARRYREDVKFFKDYQFFFFRRGRILHPWLLVLLLFPVLIPVFYKIRNFSDLKFSVKFYAYLLVLRLQIWRQGLREHIAVV